MTFQTPDTFYFIAVDFRQLGFGAGGDLCAEFDQIVDQYVDLEDERRRVFRVDMDASNRPAAIADVTHEVEAVLEQRREEYFADAPIWEIDPEHDNPDPYDEKCDMRREAV